MFTAQGFGPVSLGDIASVVGIGRTTMYDYFIDKDDILASLVEAELPLLIEKIHADEPTGGAAGDLLAHRVGWMVRFLADRSNLGTLVMKENPPLTDDARRRVAAVHRLLVDELLTVYRAGAGSGEFRKVPDRLAGHLLEGVVACAARTMLYGELTERELDTVSDHLVDFVLLGISGG